MTAPKASRRFAEAVSRFESPKALRLYWALVLKVAGCPERARATESEIVDMLREGLRYAEIRKRLTEGERQNEPDQN